MQVDELVGKYILLREKKAQMKADYESKVKDVDALLDKCEQMLLKAMNEQGLESMKSANGTAYKQKRTSASVADWDSFFAWVQENHMWTMLEHRAAKSAVEEYRNTNNDLPPGLNWREEIVVNVRRS